MAHDEAIAAQIRELLTGDDVNEMKMFGGLAFLVRGNMAVAASGEGGLLVRVDPADAPGIVETSKARYMEMRGREMRGWLRVDAEDIREGPELSKWVDLGTTYARTLPAKG